MPRAEEEELKRRARKLGLTGKRFNAYVYGTLRKMGWKPEHHSPEEWVPPEEQETTRDWWKVPRQLLGATPWGIAYRGFQYAFPEEPAPLPSRPALGVEGKRAAAEQARSFQQVLNQQMMRNIGLLERQFGTAGRYFSGQLPRYVGEEMGRTGQLLGQMVSGTEMDRFRAVLEAQLAREQMGISEEQFQAQLEAGGVAAERQMYGQIGQAILLYLMQHPELLAAL